MPQDEFNLSSFLPKKAPSLLENKKPTLLSDFLPKSSLTTISKSQSVSKEKPQSSQSIIKNSEQEINIKKTLEEEKSLTLIAENEIPYEDREEDLSNIKFPVSFKAVMKNHSKNVSAIGLDPAGARMVSGGYDYHVKIWDFNGMDQSLKPFRSILPWDSYHIRESVFSLRGDQFLVASASPTVKLYDRDGAELCEYARGDQYLRDMKKTKGHIASVTSCSWHPTDKYYFMTSSLDSTIRIWNVDEKKTQFAVITTKGSTGNHVSNGLYAAKFLKNPDLIVGARQDGSLSIWNWKTPYLKAKLHLENAHITGTETSGLCVAEDGFTIVSRGGDDTVKVWDMRSFTKPVCVKENIMNYFPETDVIFSPDQRFILTGTSVKKDQGNSHLLILNRHNLEEVNSIEFENTSTVRLTWHEKLNQIFVGCSNAQIYALYDNELSSKKGIRLSLSKKAKQMTNRAFVPYEAAYIPDEEGYFHEQDDWRRERGRKRKDPIQSKRPELPPNMPTETKKRGKIASETQVILKNMIKNTKWDEDPREALLRVAKEAEEDPKWVAHAYKKTQPVTIFDTQSEEQ